MLGVAGSSFGEMGQATTDRLAPGSNSSKLMPLQEETEDEKVLGEAECTICIIQKADAVQLPCGHSGVCFDCAQQLHNVSIRKRNCHLCRMRVQRVVQIDMDSLNSGGPYLRVTKCLYLNKR